MRKFFLVTIVILSAGPQSFAQTARNGEWSAWEQLNGKYPLNLQMRVRCVPSLANNKSSRWEVQLFSTQNVTMAVKDKSANYRLDPQRVIDLAPIEVQKCAKPLDLKFDTWRADNPRGLHHAIHYKNASVTVKLHQPTDWLGAAAEGMTGVAAGLGGTPLPPQNTGDSSDTPATENSGSSSGGSAESSNTAQTTYAPPMRRVGQSNTASGSTQTQTPQYVEAVPQCVRLEYRNDLFIVNRCNLKIQVYYTSAGDIWGTAYIQPDDDNNTGQSSRHVQQVGGITFFACPHGSWVVDPQGNVIWDRHYKGPYSCRKL